MPDSPVNVYENRKETATGQRDQFHRRWSLLGNLRLVAALVTTIAIWQMFNSDGNRWPIVAVIGFVAFLVLAAQQRQAGIVRQQHDAQVQVNERAIARINHSWDDLSLPADPGVDRTHPYAFDLNVVGRASLAQRVGTPSTNHGWNALNSALLTDRDLSDIGERQRAIGELATKVDLRQQVEAVGLGNEEVPDPTSFIEWSTGSDWLASRQWLRWVAIIGPVLFIAIGVLVLVGVVRWPLLLIPITLNTIAFTMAGGGAAAEVQRVSPMRAAISGYSEIMATIAADEPDASMLRSLDSRLSGAAAAMKSLSRMANFSIPPGSMLYFPIQMAFMWDVNVLFVLENWRKAHGADVDGWLNAMGEWESLAALAVLTHDNPDWTVPTIENSAPGFRAESMAHPLLHHRIAVPNDATIEPAGSFLFVTGSNMSGKSTLLRAIGANAVLAQAGAAVNARSLAMPPLRISSCMRVEDSLAHGVSFFMAELLRLKAVIDNVQETDDRMSLYLLDEILQGTNTAERQIASRHVLNQLTGLNAIGAVSSHDLELIEGTSLEQDAVAVHFAETFSRTNGEPDMTFDYKLRPGLATSSNAIRLMELIGFDISES